MLVAENLLIYSLSQLQMIFIYLCFFSYTMLADYFSNGLLGEDFGFSRQHGKKKIKLIKLKIQHSTWI